jgi:hypothetical protein
MAQEIIDISNADGSPSGLPISSTFNNFRVPSTLIVTPNNELTFVGKDKKKIVYPATSTIKIVDKKYTLGANKEGQLFNEKGETIDWGSFPLDSVVVSEKLLPTKMADITKDSTKTELTKKNNEQTFLLIASWASFAYIAKTSWGKTKGLDMAIITFGVLNAYNTYNTFKK